MVASMWVEEGSNGPIEVGRRRAANRRDGSSRASPIQICRSAARWTYEIAPAPNGTTLTITEDGEVYNPIFRFMSRFVFGHEATMASYLERRRRRRWG